MLYITSLIMIVCIVIYPWSVVLDNTDKIRACARDHNVYQCELIAVPIKPTPPKQEKE